MMLGNVHPEDRPLADYIARRAGEVALAHDLPLKIVEHKRRPHPDGTTGLCYVNEGRVSIVIRRRTGKVWADRHRDPDDIVQTTCHELAHLRYVNHGAAHREYEAAIRQTWDGRRS